MKPQTAFDIRLDLIRHRLDQITRPKFDREDVEELLTEIARLRNLEAHANDRAEEELYRMNDMIGVITRAKEQLTALMEENARMHERMKALRLSDGLSIGGPRWPHADVPPEGWNVPPDTPETVAEKARQAATVMRHAGAILRKKREEDEPF